MIENEMIALEIENTIIFHQFIYNFNKDDNRKEKTLDSIN